MADTRDWRTGSHYAMTLRVNAGSQASYALAPVRSRAAARDDARPRAPASSPAPAPSPAPAARVVAKAENSRYANATPPPGLSLRGQHALTAYTQLQVTEQRAQYSQLLGVDLYA